MEAIETSNVTPDTGAVETADQNQANSHSSDSERAHSTRKAPPTSSREGRGNAAGSATPTQSEKNKIKEQIKELGDSDMDALVSIKVNGQTKKVPLREAIKVSQLEQASHQKMQEAAQLKRQFQEFAKQAKDNPDFFFEQFGIDPDAYSEARLAKKLEALSLSPEQRKAREMEDRLKHYEEQEKRQKEESENRKQVEEESRIARQLDLEMTEAFKEANLPKDPFYVQLMAAQMLQAERRGEKLSAKEAALAVKDRFSSHVNSILGSMDQGSLLSFLSENVRKAIREGELKRVTEKAPPHLNSVAEKGSPSQQHAHSKSQKPAKALTEKEWREWVKNR